MKTLPAVTANTAAQYTARLNFNHPCKELVWVGQRQNNAAANLWANWKAGGGQNPFTSCLLKLNGHDRFSAREGDWFNLVQPYEHHTRTPAGSGICVYSFALKPEEFQPSGTCNFSRIDNAQLFVTVFYARCKC